MNVAPEFTFIVPVEILNVPELRNVPLIVRSSPLPLTTDKAIPGFVVICPPVLITN